jgi:hypothetical protein
LGASFPLLRDGSGKAGVEIGWFYLFIFLTYR